MGPWLGTLVSMDRCARSKRLRGDTRSHVQHVGALSIRGHAEARAFLHGHALEGHHWRNALSQYLVEGMDLDQAAWSRLLTRVDDETLALHVYCKRDDAVWDALAIEHERVGRVLHAARDRSARYKAAVSWSPANYASAELSQTRWRVLESLLEQDRQAAIPYLIDGPWDGSYIYRNRCINRCDLDWPGVRERLAELARMHESESAEVASRRLKDALDRP